MAVSRPSKAVRGLDAKERIFVAEYLVTLDPAKAAIKAGYSKTMARTKCYAWVSKPQVKPHVYAAIQAGLTRKEQRLELTADRVLQELARIALFDPRKLFHDDGTMKNPKEWDDQTASAVASIEVVEELKPDGKADGELVFKPVYTKKVRTNDKNGALTLAMKHLGMLREKVEIVGGNVTFHLKY